MAQLFQSTPAFHDPQEYEGFHGGWSASFENYDEEWGTGEDPTEEKIVALFQTFREQCINGSIDEIDAMYLAGIVTGWFERAWSR
ncbi:MAG TPA: hypothetical protein VF458_16215 [Ktedonobacteraceae bacterium]